VGVLLGMVVVVALAVDVGKAVSDAIVIFVSEAPCIAVCLKEESWVADEAVLHAARVHNTSKQTNNFLAIDFIDINFYK
jgi:hypothetical protein